MLSEEILAALITAFVAILTAYFAFRQSQSRMKKEFTFNALEVTYFNESFVLSRQIISQAEKNGSWPYESMSEDEQKAISDLLNFYEFLCMGIYEGTLDKRQVLILHGRRIQNIYRACEGHIHARRKQLGRPKLWRYVELVAKNMEIPFIP